MNKRGQIFIFAAIIVALATFVLFTKPNTMQEEILLENFGEVSQNYLNEAPKVADYSIYNEELVEEKLNDYTSNFLNYARKDLDPNVGVVYIYSNKTDLIVDNHLKGKAVTLIQDPDEVPLGVALSRDTNIIGDLELIDTGNAVKTKTDLCVEDNKHYCILKEEVEPAANVIFLKIDEYIYSFDVTTESPNLMVIVKSSLGETTKVDKFQTQI